MDQISVKTSIRLSVETMFSSFLLIFFYSAQKSFLSGQRLDYSLEMPQVS